MSRPNRRHAGQGGAWRKKLARSDEQTVSIGDIHDLYDELEGHFSRPGTPVSPPTPTERVELERIDDVLPGKVVRIAPDDTEKMQDTIANAPLPDIDDLSMDLEMTPLVTLGGEEEFAADLGGGMMPTVKGSYAPSKEARPLVAELGDETVDAAFQKEVAKRTNSMSMGKQEAEIEVFIDTLVEKVGDIHDALLYVVSKMSNEPKIDVLVNQLIHRGANPSAVDIDLKTPLHYAVERNFKGVATKLLENDASPEVRDVKGTLPLHIAKENANDEICALLLSYMPNSTVRRLFTGKEKDQIEMESSLSFQDWLQNTDMQRTKMAVLDCLIEPGVDDSVEVFYNVLECDDKGRTPDDPGFDSKSNSALQLIAKEGDRDLVYHDAVRLLIRHKWKEYAQRRFIINSCIYLLTLFTLSYSALVAATTEDPTKYGTALQVSRGIMEVISICRAVMNLVTELVQLYRQRLEYIHDVFNVLDISSSVLLLCVVPLRFTHQDAQWHVFAFGYLFWTLRTFKFAAIFRQTGAYAQVIYRIIVVDLVQFMAAFLVILLAFSGSFLLALRGDHDLQTHEETSTIWGIVFVGVRTLVEGGAIVEYTGDGGYRTTSAFFMLGFLFTCCVILLNLLIAQLSDTYQNIQQDAQRGLEVTRTWIVARVELNQFFCAKDYRRIYYKESEVIEDLKNELSKWDSPPINETNQYVKDIWESLDNHKTNLATMRQRMATQEGTLRSIEDQLKILVEVTQALNRKR